METDTYSSCNLGMTRLIVWISIVEKMQRQSAKLEKSLLIYSDG